MMKNNACLLILVPLILVTYGGALPAQEKTWDFHYEKDPFGEEALLDLRFLNEEVAGSHGFVGLSADGNSFEFEDGTPVRWWPVNGGNLATRKDFSEEKLAYFARFLAKQGVNMIRFHGSINPPGKGMQINQVDTADVDAIWRMVAFMKKEGIYSTISPFWAHNGHMGGWVPEEWGIEGYSGNDALWAVMYFSDTLQQAYKQWVRYLYTTPNPYTGIPLKDDPAVGLIQVKNEDGLFFWTFQHIKPELKAEIGKQFTAWLEAKYGSHRAALRAWNDLEIEGDRPGEGITGLFVSWHMTMELNGDSAIRMADQVEFMAEKQFDFYREMAAYYQDELSCRQLVNANNWKTADAGRLLDLERYTYSAADVVAVNRYYAPEHAGKNNGWRIDPGHYYVGASVLHHPDKLPVNIKQLEGMPHVVTESGWNTPHRYMAEGPFLISAYQSLTGIDGFYWFFPTSESYDSFPYHSSTRDGQGRYAMNRWTCSVPGIMGMFPANALAYRMGYIREGKTLVQEQRSMASLYRRELPLITEESGFDPNRDQAFSRKNSGAATGTYLSPLSYLAGRVAVRFGEEGGESRVDPMLESLSDPAAGMIRSSTGELEWDYNRGICTLNAPKVQGVCGFLDRQKRFDLDEVIIQSDNPYASVNVVSLDGKDLDKSGRILVQVGTVYQPTGWKEEPAVFSHDGKEKQGYRILDTGSMPWQGEKVQVRLSLKNNRIVSRALILNNSGYETGAFPLEETQGSRSLTLPPDCMYIILTK